jgi:putative ABC transport system permease protein
MHPVLGLLMAYLAGSVPTAYLAGRLLKGIDLRRAGSGNLGATNVYRILGAPAAVVVLASVILVIRQRIREIGIMKAIGASNGQIGFQFGLETTVITVVATVFGIVLSLLFGQQIANLFTSNNGPTRTVTSAGGFGGRGTAVFGSGGGRIFAGSIGGIHVAVSPEVVIIAFASAIILAIAASVIPVWYIARVRPAEVLRNE